MRHCLLSAGWPALYETIADSNPLVSDLLFTVLYKSRLYLCDAIGVDLPLLLPYRHTIILYIREAMVMYYFITMESQPCMMCYAPTVVDAAGHIEVFLSSCPLSDPNLIPWAVRSIEAGILASPIHQIEDRSTRLGIDPYLIRTDP